MLLFGWISCLMYTISKSQKFWIEIWNFQCNFEIDRFHEKMNDQKRKRKFKCCSPCLINWVNIELFFFFWSMHITRAQQMRFSLVTKIFFKLGNGSINIELSNDDSLEWFIYLTINKSEKVIDRWHFEFLKKSRYRKPEVKKQKFLKMQILNWKKCL